MSTTSRGSILLGFSLVIFFLSLAAAGSVWYLKQRPVPADHSPTPAGTTAANEEHVLNPTVVIDAAVADQRGAIESNLVSRLRQHYATQEDRLTTIAVAAADDEKYPARVTLTIVSPANKERTASFLYDFTPWTPSMLDNE